MHDPDCWPTLRNCHGSKRNPEATMARTAAISESLTGSGLVPKPTLRTTPGAVTTGDDRSLKSNRQKR